MVRLNTLNQRLRSLGIDQIKNVIQDLFEIQTAVHGYLGPETQRTLVQKV